MDAKVTTSTFERVRSLDVYRGLVVATMIFVNYVHGLPHMPAWLLHADERPDTFTFPDLVFPGFLMLVGVAVPLSLRRYFQGALPLPALLLHVFTRSAGLLLLGVVLEFHKTLVPEHTGLSQNTWLLAFYVGTLLLWLSYPEPRSERQKRLFRAARLFGAALLVLMLALFKGPAKPGGGYEWLQHGWWGILGIIGWAYLSSTLLYLLVRGKDLALLGVLGLQVALYMGGRHGRLDFLGPTINDFVSVGELFGSSSSAIVIGALIGNRFVAREPARDRVRFMLALGAGCYLCAALLRPVHGYSKIAGTESFFLATCGIHAALLGLVYYAVDVRGWSRGTAALGLVGSNALLAYVLPDVWTTLLTSLGLDSLWRRGAWALSGQGFVLATFNALLVSGLMLALAAILTRRGLRLRL